MDPQDYPLSLDHATPATLHHVYEAARRHANEFLRRALDNAEQNGPDGVIVRNEFDLTLLRNVVALESFEV